MIDAVLVNLRARLTGLPVQREHLGLACLAAYLRADGYEVDIIDGAFLDLDEDGLLGRVADLDPRVVGFSPFLDNMGDVLHAVEALREQGLTAHITLGGHHATFICREILRDSHGTDSIVLGEGEEALAELVSCLASARPWQGIANVAHRSGTGEVTVNPCRPLIADLDALPSAWRGPGPHSARAGRRAHPSAALPARQRG